MKRLFGTDGIRAVAGQPPLDPATVRMFGAALGRVLAAEGGSQVVLGRDTRESGPWLAEAVAAGLESESVHATDAGVISTPGLALLVRSREYAAGVMISASHNPFGDNGLKVFGADGMKLSDELEQRIERLILDEGIADPAAPASPPSRPSDSSLVNDYIEFLQAVVSPPGSFRGIRVVLDCANGSACEIAPQVFRHHGATVETLGVSPNGRNINLGCGSLHLEQLAEQVVRRGFDLGIAFDGDADRCLAVDRRGRTVDGDHLLYITGRHLEQQGRLRGDAVVATIMSNFWLEEWLARDGIRLLRAPVGDKYVLERMIQEDAVLGGEQSGHIILRERSTTGDGILTGLTLLETLGQIDQPLDAILDRIEPYPQILLNVRVREKPDLRGHPTIGPLVIEIEHGLAGAGRVVLRYSGTEPVARVMLEGRDPEAVRLHAEHLAGVISREIGC